MSRILCALVLLATAAALPSCIAVGGTENQTHAEPTVGQQLIDLKSALDKGAISQPEYDQKKAQLLAAKH